jgi:hypothetical protein
LLFTKKNNSEYKKLKTAFIFTSRQKYFFAKKKKGGLNALQLPVVSNLYFFAPCVFILITGGGMGKDGYGTSIYFSIQN